jgi:hypothetical protein
VHLVVDVDVKTSRRRPALGRSSHDVRRNYFCLNNGYAPRFEIALPYSIAEQIYSTKEALLEHCRAILRATADGASVSEEHLPFLFELFRYHDEWSSKSAGGVRAITAMQTPHGTRCFALVKHDGTSIDISFPHAVRHVPTLRSSQLQPQALRDFRDAARRAIQQQIWSFRDSALRGTPVCPIGGEVVTMSNYAVDHEPPRTFDQLLFEFCRAHSVNPLTVVVASHAGTVPVFEDEALARSWQSYHQTNARLRLVSRLSNLTLPKVSVSWGAVCGYVQGVA